MKLRITKCQLRRIVKEEAMRLHEASHPDQQLIDEISRKFDGLQRLIADLRDGSEERQSRRRSLRNKLDSAVRSVQNAEMMFQDYVHGLDSRDFPA